MRKIVLLHILLLLSLRSGVLSAVLPKPPVGCALAIAVVPQEELHVWNFGELELDHVFFTADEHFGHDRILSLASRPFKTVAEMNEKLIRLWNERVGQDSIVFVVGDFSMNLEQVRRILPRLMGEKILIAGNHDLCHPLNQKCRSESDYHRLKAAYLDAGFAEVYMAAKVKFPGRNEAIVSHYPFCNEHYLQIDNIAGLPFLIQDDGASTLVCGHVHDRWATSAQGRMINVGVDVRGFAPLSGRELRELMRDK